MSSELILWIKKIIVILFIGILLYIWYLLQSIILMIFLSGCITIVIHPVIEKGNKYHIPDWLTIIGIYTILFLFSLVVLWTIIPIFLEYISSWVWALTLWIWETQRTYALEWMNGFNIPNIIQETIETLIWHASLDNIFNLLQKNAVAIQDFLKNSITILTNSSITVIGSIGNTIIQGFILIIMSFLMALERNHIGKFILSIVPDETGEYIKKQFHWTQNIIGHWLYGQLVLGGSIFLITLIGLLITEFVFSFHTGKIFTLALIAGIMEFIPYVWPLIALLPAIIIGIWISWKVGLILLMLYILIQQIENNILVPWVMSKSLELSPFLVFIVMISWWLIGWVLWIILAIPVAATIRMLVLDFIRKHKDLEFIEENIPVKPHPIRKMIAHIKK